jgi:hypothetical protein
LRWKAQDRIESRRWFFQGTPTEAQFLSAVSLVSLPDGRIRRVVWSANGGAGLEIQEKALKGPIRLAQDASPEAIQEANLLPFQGGEASSRRLASDRTGLRLEYLAVDPQTGESTWLGEWDPVKQAFLPNAVRLTGRMGKGSEAGAAFRWVFPLTNRKTGWPDYQKDAKG